MLISTTSLGMRDQKSPLGQPIKGQIKWFDPVKGFGFLSNAEEEAGDVLLHSNVLRSFGQSSIDEGALVEVIAIQTARGRQAVEVLSIAPPPLNAQAATAINELAAMSEADFAAPPLLPARVKWYNRNKGFGFANIFGSAGDVFLHTEVLRRCGFVDLADGEAVALRVFLAKRSMIATEVSAWVNVGGGSKLESIRL